MPPQRQSPKHNAFYFNSIFIQPLYEQMTYNNSISIMPILRHDIISIFLLVDIVGVAGEGGRNRFLSTEKNKHERNKNVKTKQ